jgi:hypothetical protein
LARSSVAKKATGPATVSVNRPREIVQLPGQNNQENNLLPLTLQAALLARRFKWSAARAVVTATLAFGEAR